MQGKQDEAKAKTRGGLIMEGHYCWMYIYVFIFVSYMLSVDNIDSV
jgi:hypothetical protein